MSLASVQPVAGEDLLARRGELILLCSATDQVADTVDALIQAQADVAAAGGDAAAFADRIDAVVADGVPGLDLVLLGETGPSLLVAVYGHAWANVSTEYGDQNLALRNASQLVRSVLSGQVKALRAGLGDLDLSLAADRWVSLDAGVVRAGGVVYAGPGAHTASTAVAAAPVPPPAPAPAAPPAPPPPVAPPPVAPPPVAPPPVAPPPIAPPMAEPTVAHVVPPPPPPPPPAPAVDPAAAGPHMPDPVTPHPVAYEPPPPPPPPPITPPAPPAPAPQPAAPIEAVPASIAAGPPHTEPSSNFSAISLIGAQMPVDDVREPLPVVTAPPPPPAPDVAPAAHPMDDDRVQVLGVYCKNGHFDDPSARYCAVCGISMAQLTLIPRPGPRPPLGVLVIDDGSVFSLDTDYVLGRDPSQDPDVIAGTARPLRFDDAEGVLSRRHARIVLDGWTVTVVDLGSANGTGVKGPTDTDWHPVPARTSVALRPGSQIGLGRRNLRYESHRNT